MSGIEDLSTLLADMQPELQPGRYVFVTLATGRYGDGADLEPIASCLEREGLSLVVPHAKAVENGMAHDSVFRLISLVVHSSLSAVGLTAAIAARLTAEQISANVVAGHFHDHLFVPEERADDAMLALRALR